MANLVITDTCNLACPYCFAGQALPAERRFIEMVDFEARLDFLQRSGVDQARLIGGEPTLHPQFPELVRRIRQRGLIVIVFSHGLMPPKALNCLADLPVEACTVLVNLNASRNPSGPDQREQGQRLETLRRLGQRALPGFNLVSPQIELDFILPLIQNSGCYPAIRLGLAHAMLGGGNQYLHPRQYRLVTPKIVAFARQAARQGVRLEFDCGFVRCMFSDQELRELESAQADIGWRCSPVLDIDLDGRALHCFPLAGSSQISLDADSLASDLRNALAQALAGYRQSGVYRECSTCVFKQKGACPGGCLAATIRRFRPGRGYLEVPEDCLIQPGLGTAGVSP
jgi:hypothetical protein